MKHTVRTSLATLAVLTAATACSAWDYSGRAPQIPNGPAVSATLAPPTPSAATPVATPAATAPAAASAATPAATHTDYSVAANWLCRPGIANNACEVNIDATVVKADGSTSLEKFSGNPNAPIDCFYIYPTVSLDPFMLSDLVPGPEELNVVKAQLARLGGQCRIYAPMYRQFTLPALRARMSGGAAVPARGTLADANTDVDDAWAWYLANENKGRGVVILGHSQGAGQIMRLIASKVDGKPDQAKLVSAIVMGGSVQVPKGADVGGTFKNIPACRSAAQTGCVITFSSFRATVPPGEKASFGLGRDGNEALCTNPASLGGGKGEAKAYWSTADKAWAKGKTIATPFVATPGLTTIECVNDGVHNYLSVAFNADASDARIDDPGTDVMAQGKPDPNWGLHLNDANIVMGNLVDILGREATAWKKAHP